VSRMWVAETREGEFAQEGSKIGATDDSAVLRVGVLQGSVPGVVDVLISSIGWGPAKHSTEVQPKKADANEHAHC
jgi:hypothetical protein